MKQQNFTKGRLGEKIAADYLRKKGYQIIETNFRTRFGEIDIICSGSNWLVFVEVKLKTGNDFGSPEEMITPSKIWQVQKTAQTYLQQSPQIAAKHQRYRIDAVCITLDSNGEIKQVNHYENVPSN